MPLFQVNFNKGYIALPIAIYFDTWKTTKRHIDVVFYIGPFSIEMGWN